MNVRIIPLPEEIALSDEPLAQAAQALYLRGLDIVTEMGGESFDHAERSHRGSVNAERDGVASVTSIAALDAIARHFTRPGSLDDSDPARTAFIRGVHLTALAFTHYLEDHDARTQEDADPDDR